VPARRAYTAQELADRLERRRAAAREGMARLRAQRRLTQPVNATPEPVNPTPGQERRGDANPPTPPVSLSLLERKKVEHLLSSFVDRGYKHDPRFWELVRARYPHLDLELEVLKLAEWLDEPRNAKRKCSKGFIANWLSKADVDRQQREAQARTLPPTGQNGSGPLAPRPGPGRPPDPAPVLPADVVLQRIDPAAAQRALAEARRLTLPEKLALAKNGKH
jgi:hypothetical protein